MYRHDTSQPNWCIYWLRHRLNKNENVFIIHNFNVTTILVSTLTVNQCFASNLSQVTDSFHYQFYIFCFRLTLRKSFVSKFLSVNPCCLFPKISPPWLNSLWNIEYYTVSYFLVSTVFKLFNKPQLKRN